MMSKRKSHNPTKRLANTTRAKMRNAFVVWHSFDDDMAELWHKSGKRITPDAQLHHAMTSIRYNWSVIMSVFGKDQFGQVYMKSAILETQEPYTHAELCDELNKQHKKIIESINESHFIGAGWLANINGSDLTEEEVFNLYKAAGVAA